MADDINSSEEAPFPTAQDVAVVLRKNRKEAHALLRSTWKHKADANVPQALWNWFQESNHPASLVLRYWYYFVIFFLIATLGLIPIFALSAGSPPTGLFNLFAITLNIGTLVFSATTGHKVRTLFATHVLSHGGRVCIHCGYLLDGLPEDHRCPECGNAYNIRDLRRQWLRWMSNYPPKSKVKPPN